MGATDSEHRRVMIRGRRALTSGIVAIVLALIGAFA